ncbi:MULTISPECIES: hypothetical protein [unclassified Paenibacillus]|uniref:hypothetical protein n=1 Tax=unclassified Paenibacillus TaxID=185978 RepID=UPI00191D0643|nr:MULTISPECIES: hypothetical protein [unclassified Paenibacillus]BCO11109.1 hypothetical protein [Paenibacillus sp.]
MDEYYLFSSPESLVSPFAVRPDSTWKMTYLTTSAGFFVTLSILQGNAVDSITGDVERQTLNGTTWQKGTVSGFSKTKANTGKVFTWNAAPVAVAEAYIYDITVKDSGSTYNYSNKGKYNQVRYHFSGGHYGKMAAMGGERHHIVSSAALKSVGLSSYAGPAMRMLTKDHKLTPNHANSTEAQNYRAKELQYLKNKQYQELLNFTVDNLKKIADPGGGYGTLANKYRYALSDALFYAHQYFNIPIK